LTNFPCAQKILHAPSSSEISSPIGGRMSPSRRNFLKIATAGGIATSFLGFDLAQARAQTSQTKQGGNMKSQPSETKASIVFCHGIWADGSCFSKVIPALQAEGHQCIARNTRSTQPRTTQPP
jgi:hypothetical protein